ncbi:MAG: acylneuraminate cytidylyltransferase [Treponema sp.]|nr:acylneuraminate cytidylyltransferase [Treponema sp.]
MISGKTVLALVPVRAGSKSIPLKNIKDFCGRPLVYWTVGALQDCPVVDRVVVATDSPKIKAAVATFGFPKIELYDRRPENACDTASTESVMLEYIEASGLHDDAVLMLVQATSPLTRAEDVAGGLALYATGEFDSVLSCVRSRRFFWNGDGTPRNYDYMHRPRRQDFDGTLMENGAFYINSVGNIKEFKNRLSGRIGIYEMPEYTAAEIDEPDDWTVLECLMRRHVLGGRTGTVPATATAAAGRDARSATPALPKIRLFLTDCDGCLTDGGMYYGEQGDELKRFNARDGMAFRLLREHGILTGIITGEDMALNARRARKLGADVLEQGTQDKLAVLGRVCRERGIALSEVAYMGDDVNDLGCLTAVGNAGGIAACPADAVDAARDAATFVATRAGGCGAVRELADMILRSCR